MMIVLFCWFVNSRRIRITNYTLCGFLISCYSRRAYEGLVDYKVENIKYKSLQMHGVPGKYTLVVKEKTILNICLVDIGFKLKYKKCERPGI